MESWGTWFRQNFGLILLFLLVLVMLGFLLHLTHDKADAGTLSWGREQTSLVLGAFLGLVTGVGAGVAIGQRMAAKAAEEPKQ